MARTEARLRAKTEIICRICMVQIVNDRRYDTGDLILEARGSSCEDTGFENVPERSRYIFS